MTNVPMPADALEAGAKVLADINGWHDEKGLIACMPVARLCFLAILEAWPEARRVKGYFTHDTDYYEPAFILPLPTEASHE